MKNGLKIIIPAILVIGGGLVWVIEKNRDASVTPTAILTPENSPVLAQAAEVPRLQSQKIASANDPVHTPVPVSTVVPSSPASTYIAQPGDTVSDLAATLPGGDRKVNRDAVISANPALQRNPDLVIQGKTYQIPAQPSAAAVVAAPALPETPAPVAPVVTAVEPAPIEVVHQLKYTAREGDTVSTLAGALLGSDTKENRDAIISANTSLQNNPDRMVTEKTYKIPVRESQPLAAAPTKPIQPAARPTTQPDADTLVLAGSARELHYVAQPGDNVSTLATAILGKDTRENRDKIIQNNESLKQDPDHVVAGRNYWITVPTAQQP